MIRFLKWTVGLTVALLAIDWMLGDSEDVGLVVTKDEYGDKWPFLVDQITLRCKNPGTAAVFEVNGVYYALNGNSKAQKWIDYYEIRVDTDHLLRDDPALVDYYAQRKPGEPVPKDPSTLDLIQRALPLCEN